MQVACWDFAHNWKTLAPTTADQRHLSSTKTLTSAAPSSSVIMLTGIILTQGPSMVRATAGQARELLAREWGHL